MAAVAHDGLARAIRPVHSMFDGDTIFCLSTGESTLSASTAAGLRRPDTRPVHSTHCSPPPPIASPCLHPGGHRGPIGGGAPSYADLCPSAFPPLR